MHTSKKKIALRVIVLLTACLASPTIVSAAQITTNWVAYNDHSPNYTAVNGWVTAPRVTTYDMGEVGGGGNLTNFLTGQQLTVTIASMHTGSAHRCGLAVEPTHHTA